MLGIMLARTPPVSGATHENQSASPAVSIVPETDHVLLAIKGKGKAVAAVDS